jgi:hypothetical protein
VQSSSTEWRQAINELPFDDACKVLCDTHGMENLARSLQLDVIGFLVENTSYALTDVLCLQLGLTRSEAKTRVQVASALLSLPCLREAFRSGAIDWNRLVLVTQIADTPEDDVFWAETANTYSLNQLKVILARKKAGDVCASERAQLERTIAFRHDDKTQKTTITAEYPIDIGIAMEKRTQQRADSYGIDEATGEYKRPEHAMADAFAEEFFGDKGPRAEMLLDLEPAALNGDGKADLDGHTINIETLRRLACDASLRPSFIDDHGLPIALGRKTRLFPPWLSRQIAHRDRGCRFPGCGSTRWINDHHMFEWDEDKGLTDYDNGIQLCGTHHRFVHEGHWKVRGNPDHELTFVGPDGKELTGRAPVLDKRTIDVVQTAAFASIDRAQAEREACEAQREVEWHERQRKHEQRDREARQQRDLEEARTPKPVFGTWGDPAA